MNTRMPTVFIPHGGGPWPFVDMGIPDRAGIEALAAYLRSVGAVPITPPKVLLVVSAHWEAPVPTVMTSPRPRETGILEPDERNRRLSEWSKAPAARQAHPREEHLLPMMVVAGAAEEDRGRVAYEGTFMGVRLSAYHFG